jgi:hypothetical protein
VPELVAVALPPAFVCAMNAPPVLLPELVTVALPPAFVCAKKPPVLLPEFVEVALPPPFVTDVKPTAVPEFVVVALALAFWPACGAILGKKAPAVPELVQVLSVAVIVQANCAEADEAESANKASVAVEQSACVNAEAGATQRCASRAHGRRARAANTIVKSAERELRLRTTAALPRPQTKMRITG